MKVVFDNYKEGAKYIVELLHLQFPIFRFTYYNFSYWLVNEDAKAHQWSPVQSGWHFFLGLLDVFCKVNKNVNRNEVDKNVIV